MLNLTPRQMVSALILLYIDAGGLLGFLLTQNHASEHACWPYVSVFGVLETNCTNPLIGWLWFFAIELPRMVLVVPALALAFIEAGIKNGQYGIGYFLGSIPWLAYSIPMFLIVWLGISAWRKRSMPLITILVLVLALEIVHLAAGE